MAKSGMINPETGHDYLEHELSALSHFQRVRSVHATLKTVVEEPGFKDLPSEAKDALAYGIGLLAHGGPPQP